MNWSNLCEIYFHVIWINKQNESVRLVGNIPELGNWDPNKAIEFFPAPENFPKW